MDFFQEKLNKARNGNTILFCGAGFSADCLNFEDSDEIGTGTQLRDFFTEKLKEKNETAPKQLKNIAKKMNQKFGEQGLMDLLKARYDIKNSTADMADIIKYPWTRIYTTNYDNGIEKSCCLGKRKYRSFNNLDKFDPMTKKGGMDIIHLHGFIEKWDIRNFDKSCILDADSYRNADEVLEMPLTILRGDFDRADIIVFIGYNAEDFHLSNVLYNRINLKEKIYFINRETAKIDEDIKMTQEEIGTPLYCGRKCFAADIEKILQEKGDSEPSWVNFKRYERPVAASERVTTENIEDLFVWGKLEKPLLLADIERNESRYHVLRNLVKEAKTTFEEGGRIALIRGQICDGKTIVVESLCCLFSVSKPVFTFNADYGNLLEEFSALVSYHQNAVIVIENCFEIKEVILATIAARISYSSEASLILTARDVSSEARSGDIKKLEKLQGFHQFYMPALNDEEIDSLSSLADRIAGWHNFSGTSDASRRNFIKKRCAASLPAFLVDLLHSQYVVDAYKTEYNKLFIHGADEKRIVIAIFYIASLENNRADINFLSEMFQCDVRKKIEIWQNGSNDFKMFRLILGGSFVETVPSIGAKNILRELFKSEEVVDAVAYIAEHLAEREYVTKDDYHISKFIRYSLVAPVIKDEKGIAAFFDRIGQHNSVRKYILFWVQWCIALQKLGQLEEARKRLEQAYQKAQNFERNNYWDYDYKQLNDVHSKLLIDEVRKTVKENENWQAKFRTDIDESMNITERLLKRDDVTHHLYKTLQLLAELFNNTGTGWPAIEAMRGRCKRLLALGKKRLSFVAEGKARKIAEDELERASKLIEE